MTPNEKIQHQQTMLKNQIISLLEARLIQSVDLSRHDHSTVVTITFAPEDATIKAE